MCLDLPLLLNFMICLPASDIRKVVGEIVSYHETPNFLFFLVPTGCSSFAMSLAFPFCLPYDGSIDRLFYFFFPL